MKITKENIKKAFVSHTEMIGDYVYNNQDWYEEDAERMRYILATMDMSPGDPYSDDKQLELGQEDNRFYNCIEFDYEGGYIINDVDRLRELITMSDEDVAEYINVNEYEWLGDDYDHAGEYLFKIMNNWQKCLHRMRSRTAGGDFCLRILKLSLVVFRFLIQCMMSLHSSSSIINHKRKTPANHK